MADTLLSSLVGSSKWKIVNETYQIPLWTGIGVLSVDIASDAQVSNQPLATQDLTEATVYINLLDVDVSNAKILRPPAIRMTVLVPDVSTLENILTSFVDVTATFSVTSKSIVTDAMLLKGVTVVHDNEILSASKVTMEFEQWTPDANGSYNPDGSYNASNYGVRIQKLNTISISSISSTVDGLTSSAEALYSKVTNYITG